MTTTRLPTSLITNGSHGQRLKEIFLVSVTAAALLLGWFGVARAQSADDTMSQIKVIEGLAPAGSISSDTQKEIDKANQAGTDYFKAKQDLKTAQDDAVTKLGSAVRAQSDVDSAQKAVNDAQAKLDATNKVYSGATSAATALNKAVTEYNTQKDWLDTATKSLAIANQGQAAFDAALKSTDPDVKKAVAGYKSADFAKFKVDAATGFTNAQTKTWAAQYVAQVASDAVKDPKNGLAPLQDANKTLQAAKATLATNQQASTAATAAVNNANTVAQTAQNKVDTTGAAATSQATKAFNDANSDMVSFQNKPAAPAKPSAPGNVAVVTPSSGTPIVAPAPIVVTPNAPGAGLISEHGAGVISNDGGSLVSKNSSGVLTDNGMLATGSPGNKIISDNSEGLLSEHGAGAIAQSSALLASLPVASAQQVTASNAFKQDSTISGFANITTADQDLKNAVGRLSAQDNKTLSDLKAQVASGKPLTADQANQVAAISDKIAKNMDPANVKSLQASVATKAGTPSAAPNSAPTATAAAKVATSTAAPTPAPASAAPAQSSTTANKTATVAPVAATSNSAAPTATTVPAATASKPSAQIVQAAPPPIPDATIPAAAGGSSFAGSTQLEALRQIASSQFDTINADVKRDQDASIQGSSQPLVVVKTQAAVNADDFTSSYHQAISLGSAVNAAEQSVNTLTANAKAASASLGDATKDLSNAVSAQSAAAKDAQSALVKSGFSLGTRVDDAKLISGTLSVPEATNAAVQNMNKAISAYSTARNAANTAQADLDNLKKASNPDPAKIAKATQTLSEAQKPLVNLQNAANKATELATKLQSAQKDVDAKQAAASVSFSKANTAQVNLNNASTDFSNKQSQLSAAIANAGAAQGKLQDAANTIQTQVTNDATRSAAVSEALKVAGNFDTAWKSPNTTYVDSILASAAANGNRLAVSADPLTKPQVDLAKGVAQLNSSGQLTQADKDLLNKVLGAPRGNLLDPSDEQPLANLLTKIKGVVGANDIDALKTTKLGSGYEVAVKAYDDKVAHLTEKVAPTPNSSSSYKTLSLATPGASAGPALAAPNLPGSATPTTPATTTANGANPTGGGAPTVTLPNGKVEGLGAIVPSPAELQAQKDMQGLSRQGVQQIVDAGPKVLDGFKQMLASEKDPARIKGIQADMDRITAEIKIGTQMLDPDRKSPAAGQPTAAISPATPTVTANAAPASTSPTQVASGTSVDMIKPGQGGNIISSGGDKIIGTPANAKRDNAEIAKLQETVASANNSLQKLQDEAKLAKQKGDTKSLVTIENQMKTVEAQVNSAKSALVKAEGGSPPSNVIRAQDAAGPTLANAASNATVTSSPAPTKPEQSEAPARLTTDQGKAVHQALSTIPGNLNKSEQKQFDTLSTLVDKATSKGLTPDEATQLKAGLSALADKHPKAEQQHGLNAIGTGITVARKPEQTPAIANREVAKPELGKPIVAPPVMESKGGTPPTTDMVKRPEQKGPDVKPDQAIARTTPTTPVSNPATEKKDMIPEHHMPNGTAPVAHVNPTPPPSLGGGAGEKKDMIPEHHMNNAGQPPQTPKQAVATPSAPVKPATPPPPSAPKPPALAGAGAPKMVTPPPAIKPPTPPPAAPPPGMTKH